MEEEKYLLQSYKYTIMRNNFNIHAQRLLILVAAAMQYRFDGAKLKAPMQRNNDERLKYQFHVRQIIGENNNDYKKAKENLENAMGAKVFVQLEKGWEISVIFPTIRCNENTGLINVEINKNLWFMFLELSKGYSKYRFQSAMKLSSTYSTRLYQLLAANETPITYTIDWLREMFQERERYKKNIDFYIWVIQNAVKEINAKTELEVTAEKRMHSNGKGRPSLTAVTFFVKKKAIENEGSDMQYKEIMRKYANTTLNGEILRILKQGYEFTEQEISANAQYIETAQMVMTKERLEEFLQEKRAKAMNARNPKGWIINAIKAETAALINVTGIMR